MSGAQVKFERDIPAALRDCQPCRERLRERLEGGTGVLQVDFTANGERIEVGYDPEAVSADELESVIDDEAERIGSTYIHEVVPIEGMTCDDCAATLERGVAGLEGVESVSVSFAGARMVLEYDSSRVDPERISRRVSEFGYRVSERRLYASERDAILEFLSRRESLVMIAGLVLTLIGVGLEFLPSPELIRVSLYAGAIAVAGLPIARKGLTAARRNRQLDINALMTIAIIGAALIGEWLEAATVVVLFSIGEALEDYSMDRARRSIRSLMSLTPDEATIRRDGKEMTLPVDEIVPGDVVIVRPGGRMPVDGVVVLGESLVDQSPITGESVPVEKQAGADVFSGSINGGGVLEIRATRPASDSTIARIIHMVEEAQSQKAPSQRFVDVFAKYYTPAVVVSAAIIATAPPLFFGGDWGGWFYRALVLLVIACPCALVISTPVSIVSAIASAARNGVLVKGGAYIEALGNIRAIAFDKTGTLTLGRPSVASVVPLDGRDDADVLRFAAAAERYSEHPYGTAIVRAAEARGLVGANGAREVVAHAGRGIEAMIEGQRVQVGSRRMILGDEARPELESRLHEIEQGGQTAVLVSVDGNAIGIISLADELRADAPIAIEDLHRSGIEQTVMLTGDREEVAHSIARRVGIDEVRAELLPDQKVDAIGALLDQYGQVAMVGDGVNDAPALARSTVGIAMGAAGTDTALETSDVALMGDDLPRLGWTVRLSRRTRRIIMENIVLALGIKAVFFVLAVIGEATLWQAIVADMGASLLVILNGLRLLRSGDPIDRSDGSETVPQSVPRSVVSTTE